MYHVISSSCFEHFHRSSLEHIQLKITHLQHTPTFRFSAIADNSSLASFKEIFKSANQSVKNEKKCTVHPNSLFGGIPLHIGAINLELKCDVQYKICNDQFNHFAI
jgi:hypothetical protein